MAGTLQRTLEVMVRLELARLLRQRKMTGYALAKATGLSQTTVYSLLRRGGEFDRLEARTIDALCRALECTPGELISYRKGA
jgi:putative transcriptional regulator